MARPRIITLLMPLPTRYNPDAQGVRKPIGKWKVTRTKEEISKQVDAGAELQVFRPDKPHRFWWDRGLLANDVLAYISADLPDTEETREWLKAYARTKLIVRFQQDANYLRWLCAETELVRPATGDPKRARSEMPRGKLTAPVSLLTMIESKQHEALRLIAFNERRSVAELVREGIAEVLKKHVKSRRQARVRVVKEERVRAATGR